MYYRKGITNKVLWKEEKVIVLPRETEKSQEVITFKMISEGRIGILEPEEELSRYKKFLELKYEGIKGCGMFVKMTNCYA